MVADISACLLQLSAANFWAEMADPSSPYRPYLEALPSPDEMMCPLVMMPPEYRSLLANENAVSHSAANHWSLFLTNFVDRSVFQVVGGRSDWRSQCWSK